MLTQADYVNHILHMRTLDEAYARWALAQYNALLPHLDLNAAVRETMKGQQA